VCKRPNPAAGVLHCSIPAMLLEGAPDAEGADPAAAGAGSAGSGTGGPAEEGFAALHVGLDASGHPW
jgi:hypothetical protein